MNTYLISWRSVATLERSPVRYCRIRSLALPILVTSSDIVKAVAPHDPCMSLCCLCLYVNVNVCNTQGMSLLQSVLCRKKETVATLRAEEEARRSMAPPPWWNANPVPMWVSWRGGRVFSEEACNFLLVCNTFSSFIKNFLLLLYCYPLHY